jgi:hypothetical protein
MLYDSSRRQAGENLPALLDKRAAGLEKPLAMSDALSRTAGADAAMRMRCPCLAPGRRQFSDLEDVFPHECKVVLDVISPVCDHDEHAQEEGLSAEARLASHHGHSRPLREERQQWLDKQSDAHLVEPNSSLGKAISSMRTHWPTRTRFFTIPGAPLDNHLAERAWTLCIRQRKTSLFYQNPPRADIASVLTSLMATGLYAGVHAVEYLVALQEHRHEVCVHPAAWLPWADAASRAWPEATRRQSSAIWARSGQPCHSQMTSSRADKGTRASVLWGHHTKRPVDQLFLMPPYPCPSYSQSLSEVPERLRKT